MICPKTFLLIWKVNKGQIWPFLNKNPSIAGIPGLNFPAKLKTVQISWHYHSKIKTKLKLTRQMSLAQN
jgi:hypothetical protein